MIKTRFLPAAEAEFLKQLEYYSNTQEGLGIRFHTAVMVEVQKAAANPESGAQRPKGTRRRIVKGFPFGVVYRSSETELLVVAVAHHRMRPEYWARRVK